MNPTTLTQATLSFQLAIDQVLSEYHVAGIAPEAINSGLCEEFVSKVLSSWLSQYPGEREASFRLDLDTSNFLNDDGSDWDWPLIDAHWGGEKVPVCYRRPYQKAITGGHVWMTVEGRHYDAEAPEGVDFFLELPFFEKRLFPRRVLTRTWSRIDHAGASHVE